MVKRTLLKLPYSTRTFSSELFKFVPKHNEVRQDEIDVVKRFIDESNKILILTGAGISTESGIPDYRSEEVGLYARTNHKPIQYQEFLKNASSRQRYWARNFVGWDTFSQRQPNAIHFSIKNLEHNLNKVTSVVTQNVDNLHFKAGSEKVIELHGSAYRVICLQCNSSYNRHYIQEELKKLNPSMLESTTMIRPDGDVDIPLEAVKTFKPPFCEACNGILKPDIIFFGDNVPKTRVEDVRKAVSSSDSLLILGTSLTVFSSYRIVLQASEENKKMALINIGPTRADNLVYLKISARCGDILPRIC
ncbi:NAD-dependent protein deacylase Sirt4-like [Diorhabda sublineata]|uniref:NAD-dependent protein deacylase Sirt4-like n=1 Tax=Diorhabda sublineata TaxID=1163346 RepID=UPI0024E04DD3|nr:NAD-dependent protein deacylase Sirt4-like [Diorhabda sublineata]